MDTIHADNGFIGDPLSGASMWEGQQTHSDTCAIRCQEFIISTFTGKDVGEDALLREARDHGWYHDNHGTPSSQVGKLLELHGIPMENNFHASLNDLALALSDGEKVMVGVDSGKLWGDDLAAGSGHVDHAIVVSGIDTRDPNNIKVLVSDPGTGGQTSYSMEHFLNAVSQESDGHFQMTHTLDATPATAPEMAHFDYAAGHMPTVLDMAYDEFAGLGNRVEYLMERIEVYFHDLTNDFTHSDYTPSHTIHTNTTTHPAGYTDLVDSLFAPGGAVHFSPSVPLTPTLMTPGGHTTFDLLPSLYDLPVTLSDTPTAHDYAPVSLYTVPDSEPVHYEPTQHEPAYHETLYPDSVPSLYDSTQVASPTYEETPRDLHSSSDLYSMPDLSTSSDLYASHDSYASPETPPYPATSGEFTAPAPSLADPVYNEQTSHESTYSDPMSHEVSLAQGTYSDQEFVHRGPLPTEQTPHDAPDAESVHAGPAYADQEAIESEDRDAQLHDTQYHSVEYNGADGGGYNDSYHEPPSYEPAHEQPSYEATEDYAAHHYLA